MSCVDLIVVQQPDGTFKSTPLFVRFEREPWDTLNPIRHKVIIKINDQFIQPYTEQVDNINVFEMEVDWNESRFAKFVNPNTALLDEEKSVFTNVFQFKDVSKYKNIYKQDKYEKQLNRRRNSIISVASSSNRRGSIAATDIASPVTSSYSFGDDEGYLSSPVKRTDLNEFTFNPGGIKAAAAASSSSLKTSTTTASAISAEDDVKVVTASNQIHGHVFDALTIGDRIKRVAKEKSKPQNSVSMNFLKRIGKECPYGLEYLIPTSGMVSNLHLKQEVNRITYINCTTKEEIHGMVFFWKSTDKVVCSDIDGTITKSDVRGQLMTKFGKDWTHKDIVSLYQNISQNGYKLVYLTARGLTQISMTRNYLKRVRQMEKPLPLAPIFSSYNSFWNSVIRDKLFSNAHYVKIPTLQMIRSLFPATVNPFIAGFGNKFTDFLAYSAVGIGAEMIYIINKKGHIKRVLGSTLQNTLYNSYKVLQENSDKIFPIVQIAKEVAPNTVENVMSSEQLEAKKVVNSLVHDMEQNQKETSGTETSNEQSNV